MCVTAIIPVRAGSRRLKNKNILPFAGVNLLINKIRQLQRAKEVDNIVVSSDSDVMLGFAKEEGVKTHKRATEYCDEMTQPFGAVVRHICENVEGDHILWATCTAPLVDEALYNNSIQRYYRALEEGYDSLMSVEAFKRYMWNDEGPINYKLGLEHIPSQQLDELYFVTDGILLAPRKKMIEWSYFHGSNPYKYALDKRASVDVDDIYDLASARAWLDLETN